MKLGGMRNGIIERDKIIESAGANVDVTYENSSAYGKLKNSLRK
jgi:hypothetical protein